MYSRWGVEAPSHDTHGTVEEIRERMQQMTATSWRLEGNELIADTDQGMITQRIPTDYILDGVDEKNLPVFKKVI